MFLENAITFDSEEIAFELTNQESVQDWVQDAVTKEGKVVGEISYVFCSDEYLHKMNVEHLQHDTLTDIITFNYCEGDVISSDIFISIDRVKENADLFSVDFSVELARVMIHGVLHLVGYDDKTADQKAEMRSKEDFYLTLR